MSKSMIEYELKMRLRELRRRIRNGEMVHEEYNNTMHELQSECDIERMVACNA